MIEIRTAHALAPAEVRRRIDALASEQGIACTWRDDALGGVLERGVPFLGRARAEFEIGDAELVVRVIEAPAAFGEATLRRWVGEALARLLG